MRFRTADQAVEAYLLLRDGTLVLQAQRYTVTSGVARRKTCACTSQDTVLGRDASGSYVLRCRSCGTVLDAEAAETARGKICGAQAASAMQAAACERIELARCVDSLRIWERRAILAYVSRAILDREARPMIRQSLVDVLAECAASWPRRADGWSLYRLRLDLRDARVRLERALERARMLEAA